MNFEIQHYIIIGVFLVIFGLIGRSIYKNKKTKPGSSTEGSCSDYYQDDQENENIKGKTN